MEGGSEGWRFLKLIVFWICADAVMTTDLDCFAMSILTLAVYFGDLGSFFACTFII